MKRLAISTGVFFGIVLVCMSLALGQQRKPAPVAPVGVDAFLEVGQQYNFGVEHSRQESNFAIPQNVTILAKPDGGWVKVAGPGENPRTYLINLSHVRVITEPR